MARKYLARSAPERVDQALDLDYLIRNFLEDEEKVPGSFEGFASSINGNINIFSRTRYNLSDLFFGCWVNDWNFSSVCSLMMKLDLENR